MTELTVGLIGAGGITPSHLPAWLKLGASVRVFSEEGAPELVARFGGQVVTSAAEIYDTCGIVDVCTPTPVHRHYAEAALRAGCDVVCEKPLARSHEDAAALASLAASLGRHLYPAHVVRFFPEYAAMRAAVAAGRIGKVAVSRFTRTGTFPTWADWFADVTQSGGVAMDLMIHDMDIARWVSGDVTEVYATTSEHDDGARTAIAHAILTHASGAVSHIRGVWGPASTKFATGFSIAGDGGTLSYDSTRTGSLTMDLAPSSDVAASAGVELVPDTAFVESPYLVELREFSQAIAGGPPPRVSARDGVIATDLALAALESIRTGRVIEFATWEGDAK